MNNLVYISAFRNNHSFGGNLKRHIDLGKELERLRLRFSVVMGSWGGDVEYAYRVLDGNVGELKKIADKYEQEAILVVDGEEERETKREGDLNYSYDGDDYYTVVNGRYL